MARTSKSSILILGGMKGGHLLSDAFILDSETKSVISSITSNELSFRCRGNRHVVTQYDKVVALGQDAQENLVLAEVGIDGQGMIVIENYGHYKNV